MASESNLEVMIRIVKEGNGDQKTIEALKQMANEGKKAEVAMGQIENASEKAADANKKLGDSLKSIGGKAGEIALRSIGVPSEAIQGLKLTRTLIDGLAKGSGLAKASLVGVFSLAAIQVGRAVKEFQAMKKAQEEGVQSTKDLNAQLELQAKIFERVGIAAGTSIEEALQVASQRSASIENLGALFRERTEVTRVSQQQEQLGAAGREGAAERAQLGFQRQQVGLEGSALFESQRAAAQSEFELTQTSARASVESLERRRALEQQQLDTARELLKPLEGHTEEYQKQQQHVDKIREALAEVDRQLEVANVKQKEAVATASEELALKKAVIEQQEKEFSKKQEAERLQGLEKEKDIAEQFNDALQDAFVLEVKLKGIEDDRTAKAIAYLQATGRTSEAARLTTLELEKQRNVLSGLTPGQQAGKKIAAGGVDLEGIVGGGKTLSERSTLRNLGSQFQREIQAEERRIKKSGVTDEAAVQQQLSGFAEQRLAASPTLSKALGLPAEGQKPATEKEREALIGSAEIGKQKEEVSKELQSLGKIEAEFFKDFKSYSSTTAKEIESTKQQIKALEERIKARP